MSEGAYRDAAGGIAGAVGRLAAALHQPGAQAGMLLVLSSLSFQGARFGATLVAAVFIGPSEFGQWVLAATVLAYTPFATLGSVNAMNRDVPILLGAGRLQEACIAERAALGASGVSAAGLAAIIFGGGMLLRLDASLLAALAMAAVFQQFAFMYQASLRARLRFRHAASVQAAMTVAFVAMVLPGLMLGGVAGLLAALAGAYALGVALCAVRLLPDLSPRLPRAVLAGQIRAGLPIAVAGLGFAALISQDRWVVALMGTPDELGQYGFASTVASALIFVTLLVAQQLYPRMGHAFGQDGYPVVARLAARQSMIAGGTAACAGALVTATTVALVGTAMPQYGHITGPLVVLAVAATALGAASGHTNALLVTGRTWTLVGIYALASAAALASGVLLMQIGAGLFGPALGTLLGCGTVLVTARVAIRP